MRLRKQQRLSEGLGAVNCSFESLRESLQKMDEVLEDKGTALTAERVVRPGPCLQALNGSLSWLEEDDVYSFQDDTSSRADGRTW